MKQRSPTIEGFRLMFSRPSLGLAEIAWRWTFGSAAILSLTFLILEYLRTLPVSPGDLFLLSTRHPVLVSQAVAHIFQGSAGRLARSVFLLFILLSAAWVVLASLARTATVRALLNYFREEGAIAADQFVVPGGTNVRYRSPFGLNLLRVLATMAALLACLGTFVLAQAASPPTNPSPGSAMLVFLMLAMGIIQAWWLLNWILSLAAIFAVADASGTIGAISKAMDLWRVRWGSIVAAGAWFGIAHTVVFFIATSVVAFPLAFVGVMPAGVVLGGVLLITLWYFAAADFLYAGKMAAYVLIAKGPEESQSVSRVSSPIIPPQSGIDRGELILCDVPPLGRA
jgi:hypothetical protein